MDARYDFNFLTFTKTCFVVEHATCLGEVLCAQENNVLYFTDEIFYEYLLGPSFLIGH